MSFRALARPFAGLVASAILLVSLTLATTAGAAGCGYSGSCPPPNPQPTTLPIPSSQVVLSSVLTSAGGTFTANLGAAANNASVSASVPAGLVPGGGPATLVIAQIPAGIPALYRVNGRLEVLSAAQYGRLRSHTSGTGSSIVPQRFVTVDAFYVQVLNDSGQPVTNWLHAITVTVTDSHIATTNKVFVTRNLTWYQDPSAQLAPGRAVLTLNTSRVFQIINPLGANVTVTYSANGGTGAAESVSIPSGASITLPTGVGLVRHGYQFVGWSLNGLRPALTSPYLVRGAETLKAIWVRSTKNAITYNVNGGHGVVASQTVKGNALVNLPTGNGLRRNGFVFSGWSLSGTPPALHSPYFVTGSVTLKAIWLKAQIVYLFYESNGGTGTVPAVTVHGSGLVQLSTGATLHRKGYVFAGWSVTGQEPALVSPYDLTTSTNVKAIWIKPTTFTLTYRVKGVHSSVHPVSVTVPTLVSLDSGVHLHRKGYTFVGWSTNGRAPVLPGSYYLTQSTTLQAVWQKIVIIHVRYDDNGGTGVVPALTLNGSGVIQLNLGRTLQRPGYQFVGWSTTGALPALTSPLDVTSNLTLKAIWLLSTSTLTYNLNGGTGFVPPTQAVGNQYVTLANGSTVSRHGYGVKGWSLNGHLPALGASAFVKSSTVVKAIWVKRAPLVTFTISYNANGGTGFVPPTSVTQGAPVMLGSGQMLSRPGYTFVGWSVNGTEPIHSSTFVPTASVELKAVWINALPTTTGGATPTK